jgi:hypothetical protein
MRYVATLSLLVVILVSLAGVPAPTLAEHPLFIEGRFCGPTSTARSSSTPLLASARDSLGQLLPILATKLQRGNVRISAAISWPRVTTARAIAATIGW